MGRSLFKEATLSQLDSRLTRSKKDFRKMLSRVFYEVAKVNGRDAGYFAK
jgi:hypothetical protein